MSIMNTEMIIETRIIPVVLGMELKERKFVGEELSTVL